MNWKSIANYKILLPAWSIAITLTGLVLTILQILEWSTTILITLTSFSLAWVWLRELQEILLYLSPHKDVTLLSVPRELRQTLEEIKQSLERYATVTHNLAGAVLVRDAAGKITYCNAYTERLFGVSRETILNSPQDFLAQITPPEERQSYQKAHMLSLVGEPFRYRHRFYHSSGPEMWAETRVVPLINASGDVDATLSIMVDITKSVRDEEQTQRLNTDLQDFYYMITHDLRTPLVTLKGGLGMLKQLIEQNGQEQHLLAFEHMVHAQQRLNTLVNAVIDYGKISNQGFELIALDPLPILHDTLRIYSEQISELNATIIVPPCIPRIMAAPVPLSQIFANLLENALKYAHPERPPKINITSTITARSLVADVNIEFSDNGLGISTDKLETIFRPFQRGHPHVQRGSGVGLASVKKLIEKLSGNIDVSSREQQGTIFTISFEAAP